MNDSPVSKIESLVGKPVVASLANNSLLLCFECRDWTQQLSRHVLKIQNPWKLLLNGVVVGDSREFPPCIPPSLQKKIDWDRWSLGFANWMPGSITAISVGVNSPDLRLIFQSGHILEAMSEPELPADWCLQLYKGATIINAADIASYTWRSHVAD